MSTTTVAQFRGDFPEFASATAYTDARVQFYLDLAETRLDPMRWEDLWVYGVELYVAHGLSLAKARADATLAGRAPAGTAGLLTSKTVGSVSASYDVSDVTSEGAGTYNLTAYGVEYWQLMRTIGIGGMQL